MEPIYGLKSDLRLSNSAETMEYCPLTSVTIRIWWNPRKELVQDCSAPREMLIPPKRDHELYWIDVWMDKNLAVSENTDRMTEAQLT